MKILEFHERIIVNHENLRIPYEKHENHENLRIPFENQHNFENHGILRVNHENH